MYHPLLFFGIIAHSLVKACWEKFHDFCHFSADFIFIFFQNIFLQKPFKNITMALHCIQIRV